MTKPAHYLIFIQIAAWAFVLCGEGGLLLRLYHWGVHRRDQMFFIHVKPTKIKKSHSCMYYFNEALLLIIINPEALNYWYYYYFRYLQQVNKADSLAWPINFWKRIFAIIHEWSLVRMRLQFILLYTPVKQNCSEKCQTSNRLNGRFSKYNFLSRTSEWSYSVIVQHTFTCGSQQNPVL